MMSIMLSNAFGPFKDYIGCFLCFLHSSCTVDGLPLNEFRVLAEKSTTSPEWRDEKNRRVEFATPTFNVLNALEQMGYKVVTSGAFVTGHNKFDQREFVWTLHRSSTEMECQ
jgi:hypothetical protein